MSATSSPALKVPFGLKNGVIVEPSALPSGKDPECLCTVCSTILVVRRGDRRPHFAHLVGTASRYCVETALHAAAKQLLVTEKWITLPELTVKVTAGQGYNTHRPSEVLVQPEKVLHFTKCIPELTMQAIRPDVVGIFEPDETLPPGPLAIEIRVTHAVDEIKRAKIVAMGLLTLEIELDGAELEPDLTYLRKIVLGPSFLKKWIHFPGEDAVRQSLQTRVDQMAGASQARESAEARERIATKDAEPPKDPGPEELAEDHVASRRRQFRAKPDSEKEALVRRRLGIAADSAWPGAIVHSAPDHDAVLCPHHLWQAAFFQPSFTGKLGTNTHRPLGKSFYPG